MIALGVDPGIANTGWAVQGFRYVSQRAMWKGGVWGVQDRRPELGSICRNCSRVQPQKNKKTAKMDFVDSGIDRF